MRFWMTGLLLFGLVGCNGKDDDSDTVDADQDGFLSSQDCDDNNAAIHPGADEVCDEVDNDCDGEIDEEAVDMATFYADADGDMFGDILSPILACAEGEGVSANDADCDDDNVDINPDATEICDEVDNDCDELIDEEDDSLDTTTMPTWYADVDQDGFGDLADAGLVSCADPSDDTNKYSADNTDCDDTRDDVYPGATEVCDDLDTDEDCDGTAENDDDDNDTATQTTYYTDADQDMYGDAADVGTLYCDNPSTDTDWFSADHTDCDDTRADINPDADEVCDELDTDEDCDTLVDDEDDDVLPSTKTRYHQDTDQDTYGVIGRGTAYCDNPSTTTDWWSLDDTDCDDTVATTYPGATETTGDGVDSDCDDGEICFADADDDGYVDATATVTSADEDCDDAGEGTSTDLTGDCADSDEDINPGATEVCDDLDTDENCDGFADDDDSSATGQSTYYADNDGDLYGDDTDTGTDYCDPPSGVVLDNSDCDDSATGAAINPAATEICDAADTDEDCDGFADDDDSSVTGQSTYYADNDGDLYGDDTDTGTDYCDPPSGVVLDNSDCDDSASGAAINPAATEVCDAADVDENCDGFADDDDSSATGQSTYYADNDSDTYGDETDTGTDYCDPPSGVVLDNTDCDDSATGAGINPGATEVCDAADVDENCDGFADDDDSSATGQSTYYADNDSDTYGDETDTGTDYCDPPSGVVLDNTDCDDSATGAGINPAATEICDAADVDEDCDGFADDDDSSVTGQSTYYADNDGDLYGDDTDTGTDYCDPPSGVVLDNSDCDDSASGAAINPAATEVCDAADVDENCDGFADDDDSSATGQSTYYADNDGDLYGDDTDAGTDYCDPPGGVVLDNSDCDDSATGAGINPGATEICDAADTDENCDGFADDDDSSVTGQSTYYADNDGDLYGDDTDTGTDYCDPPSGVVLDNSDCDDSASGAAINPAATEVCDAADVDENCDGFADDDDSSATGQSTYYADNDGDLYGDDTDAGTDYCDPPGGVVLDNSDCDDSATGAGINPGATEICDAADTDENCDGFADDDDSSATGQSTYYTDNDGDLYGDDTDAGTDYCDPPGGVVLDNTDCDDSATGAGINPGATEICDAADTDENCDGFADDDDSSVTGQSTYYADNDGDTYGDDTDTGTDYCDPPGGVVLDNSDCDDSATGAPINPAATEICDAADTDEDCDGFADDDDSSVTGQSTYYADNDGDLYGDDTDTGTDYCDPPGGVVLNNSDCDDSASGAAINPAATEVCDAADTDEDCDGFADDDDSSATGQSTYYADNDGDLYGDDTDTGTDYCDPPGGVVLNNSDCDDSASGAAINPGATEVCDRANVDEDCDGFADDDDSSATGQLTYYVDNDGDLYGDDTDAGTDYCDPPGGVVLDNTDCDDSATGAGINPGATEVCDRANVDEDCDGFADDADSSATGQSTYYADNDNDTYGDDTDTGTDYCDPPSGVVLDNSDCNDSASGAGINPGATEVCDRANVDEDCDGFADDDDSSATGQTTFYLDDDGDTYGDENDTGSLYCDGGAGLSSNNTDCDDGDFSKNPGASEILDFKDNDCDGNYDVFDLSYADALLSGYLFDDAAGFLTSSAGDVNKDGYDDILVSSQFNDTYAADGGAVYLILGESGGVPDMSLSNADAIFYGESIEDYLGQMHGMDAAGDVNGDGYDDIVIGSRYSDTVAINAGSTYLLLGGCDGSSKCGGIETGFFASLSTTGEMDVGNADAIFTGIKAADYAGYAVAGGGDINQDGYDDILIGAYGHDSPDTNAGQTYLLLGGCDGSSTCGGTATGFFASLSSGTMSLLSADVSFEGESYGDYAGASLEFAGDINGDGYGDILIGAYNEDTGASVAGSAYLVLGGCDGGRSCGGTETGLFATAAAGSMSLMDADAKITGEAVSDNLTRNTGTSGAGDINGDGYDDIILGARYEDTAASNAGAAYIFLGGCDGASLCGSSTTGLFADLDASAVVNASDATFKITGEGTTDYFGGSVSDAGDVNKDGYGDFLVGAYRNDGFATGSGTGYVFLGGCDGATSCGGTVTGVFAEVPASGVIASTRAHAQLQGENSYDYAGWSVSLAGDTNGDGYDDLIIGARAYDGGGWSAGGGAYIVTGR